MHNIFNSKPQKIKRGFTVAQAIVSQQPFNYTYLYQPTLIFLILYLFGNSIWPR